MALDPAKKRKIFLSVLGGLAAVLVIVAAVVLSLDAGSQGEAAPSGGEGNELLVSDVYEGQTLIPNFSLKKNTYDTKKFQVIDGFLQYDDPNARLGVDVSEYQGEIDWAQVKAAGVDFAMLRVGYRGMTQGLLNADAAFERNFTEATDAGLFVGAYFYSQAVTEEEAKEEADFVIRLLNGRKLAYPIAFDWEQSALDGTGDQESHRVYGMTGEQVTKCSVAFCERIREAGYTPCVYTNKHLAYEFFDMSQWRDYDIWYAEYQKAPSLYYEFRLWQYTDEGSVPGIDGGVDLNICFKPY